MFSVVTGFSDGKLNVMQQKVKKRNPNMFIGKLHFPREYGPSSRCFLPDRYANIRESRGMAYDRSENMLGPQSRGKISQ